MRLKYIINQSYDQSFVNSKRQLYYLKTQYQVSRRYLEATRKFYQQSWDEIDEPFFRYIEKVTAYPWAYQRYYCVLSVLQPGVSNWGTSNKIVRGWFENPYLQRRITAHELIISHYFTIYNQQYADAHLNKKQVWALAEIAAFALTSLTPEVKKFWPWDTSGYYTNHNYPSIVPLQRKLKSVFLKRKDFTDYMHLGIQVVKKYSVKIRFG